MSNKGYWESINNLELAKGAILSGYHPINKKFEGSYIGEVAIKIINDKINLVNDPHERIKILDFGCGIGRIIQYLFENTNNLEQIEIEQIEIYGYDFQNMIDMARVYLGDKIWKDIIPVCNPIKNLSNLSFDLIIASLVFQHISETELRDVLGVLKSIIKDDGILLVHSRGWLDDRHLNIWKIINTYFKAESDCNIEDGSDNHQKVIFKKL